VRPAVAQGEVAGRALAGAARRAVFVHGARPAVYSLGELRCVTCCGARFPFISLQACVFLCILGAVTSCTG